MELVKQHDEESKGRDRVEDGAGLEGVNKAQSMGNNNGVVGVGRELVPIRLLDLTSSRHVAHTSGTLGDLNILKLDNAVRSGGSHCDNVKKERKGYENGQCMGETRSLFGKRRRGW